MSSSATTRGATVSQFLEVIIPHLSSLFPSFRIADPDPSQPDVDEQLDTNTWTFLGIAAAVADKAQHSDMVKALREKILLNVSSAKQHHWLSEQARKLKIENVNKFLNAVGLDSSQIAI